MIKRFSRLLAFLPLIMLLILSFAAIRPLLSPGFFTMHDNQQIARLFELNKSLVAGQFPVRWVEDLGFGYGYPLFNFYPPFTYYLGEIYHLVFGLGFIDATKLIWFTALVGSAIAMYFLAKEFFGKPGGVISAIFYLYAPYHAVDSFVRGAQAELFSFVWLPLILLFSYKSIKEQSARWAVVTGVLFALLMLTHNLIFLPFGGLFTLWWLAITLIYSRRQFVRSGLLYLVSCILGFGLTTFFWLPSLLEKQFTLVDQILIKNLASYKIHFLCWSQLWDSPWGFGGSNPGCVDGISFKIGKIHIILSGASLFLSTFIWKRDRKLSLVILSVLGLFILSAFMTTASSQFIWDHMSPLWYLQFPWRFLEFTVLFSSLLAGAVVFWVKKPVLQLLIAAIAITAVLFTNVKFFAPQTYLPNATDRQLTSDQEIKWIVSGTSFEYMSRGVATKLNDLGVVWVDIDETRIQNSRIKVQYGDWQTIQENFFPDKFSITGKSTKGANIQIQTSYFPGWKLWLDNQPIIFDINNKYQLLSLNVPLGEHTIVGRFTNTTVRSVGNVVSFIFLVLFFGLTIKYGTNRARS